MRAAPKTFAPFVRRAVVASIAVAIAVGIFLVRAATDDTVSRAAATATGASLAFDSTEFSGDVALSRRDADERDAPGFYRAPVGTEFVMRIEAESSSKLHMRMLDQAIDQAFDSKLVGSMRFRIAARQAGECIAEVVFTEITAHDVAADVGETTNDAIEEDLRRPVFVRMQDDGELVGIRFAPTIRAYPRGWMRTLLTSLRFVLPASAATTWDREEIDATGVANVRYDELEHEGDVLQLRRTKLAYIGPPPGADSIASPARYGVTGDGVAALDARLCWARGVIVAETLTAETDRVPTTMTVKLSVKAELVTVGTVPFGTSLDARFDDAWGSVAGIEDLEAMSNDAEEAGYAEYLAGISLANLLARVAAVMGAEPIDNAAVVEAFRDLSWYLRLHPEGFAEVGAAVASASPAVARVLLNAAGAAGTPAAQEFLAATIANPAQSAALRQMSLESLIQVGAPGARLVEAVLASTAAHEQDGVRGTALLVLGALASREGAQKDALVQSLLARESEASASGELPTWLGALGNSGDARAFGPASGYLDAADADVRQAAVDAIGKMESSAATAALIVRACKDSDASVRRSALEALARRSGDAAMDAVRAALGRENADLRVAMIHALGQQVASNESARSILAHVAAQDPSKQVRSMAQELLDAAH